MASKWCGRSLPRVDGLEKTTGAVRYVGDIASGGMWHGAVVRSTVASGRVRSIAFDPAFDWSRVAVVTAGDIPGENIIPIIKRDMPCLAADRVAYCGEPIALVAAPTAALLDDALRSFRVEFDPEEPLIGIEKIIRREQTAPRSVGTLHTIDIKKGDLNRGFAAADEIVEGEYFTGPQEQAYLEPQGIIALPQADGLLPQAVGLLPQAVGMRIVGSLQCPFFVRPAVACVLGVDDDKVVVEQTPTGGAFGGKEDYPSFLASYAALLALKAKAPVRMVLGREDDMAFTPKRHASWSRFKAGVKRNGLLTALEIDFVIDGGAYTTLTPVVLSRGAIHITGAYACDNVLVKARALRSNTVPAGAFRGFGAPQALFACESHMDEIAARLSIDPIALRKRNALRPGATTATGQRLDESVAAIDCLDAITRACAYDGRLSSIKKQNTQPGRARRGLGTALFWHGGGFTGSGEDRIASRARLELGSDGRVAIRVSSTEMGQGSVTTLSQILADACGIDIGLVDYPLPDTAHVPDSGPTVASRTTMIVGKIVECCGHGVVAEIERRLGAAACGEGEFKASDGTTMTWAQAAAAALCQGPLIVEREYETPPGLTWDEETHRGDAYAAYAWGAVAVEVAVDTITFEVTPLDVWCAVDVGKAINPLAARAQIEGGLIQALGYGLLEEVTLGEDGLPREKRFQTYVVPTTADTPALHVELLEFPYSHGPAGAKGIGELPMNGLAPALRNALRHALGISVNQLPATPERILDALESSGAITSHGAIEKR